tara:strand:- start:476 stop:1141 length:666 start_codon:yes stop_codon:yes gene_type:complete
MKYCLLSEATPSTAIHCLYYAQTQGIKISNVILVGNGDEKYTFFYEYSEVNEIDLYFVKNPNGRECESILKAINTDILLIMVGTILGENILQIPKITTLNAHAGILPQYRGLDCVRWAIFNGDKIGVSVHVVNSGLDLGPIIARQYLSIRPNDTVKKIQERNYYTNKWQTMIRGLKQIEENKTEYISQKKSEGKQYYKMHNQMTEIVDILLKKKISDNISR